MVGSRTRTAALVLLAVLLAAWTVPAHAIPAFARKYGISCSTCHAPIPRLKAYGDEFAGNAFQLPDDQEPARAYRDTGDPLLILQRELPVAVRLDAFYVHGEGDGNVFRDFQTPWGLKLLSGGTVAEDVGYYFYFYMSERGEVAGVEDAYLHFNDIGGTGLDVMMGQFQISDPLMKRELRLTYEDYQAYKAAPGASMTDLTYDRGLMILYDLPFGVGLVGQIVNGNGKAEAGADRRFDVDRDKGWAGRAFYEAGPLMIGGFFYGASEQITPAAPAAAFTNEVTDLGADLSLALMDDRLTVTGQFLRREDSHPGTGLLDIVTDAGVVEAVLLPNGVDGRHALTVLYNTVESDDASIDYETATVSLSRLHARNLRMMVEVTRDLNAETTRFVAGFVAGF
jgi:hypothetical protein